MKKKKVSILVAAYNVEKTISQAVQSILKQTYDNMEILVVNDGSTDNTTEILKKFTDKVLIINKVNEGGADVKIMDRFFRHREVQLWTSCKW